MVSPAIHALKNSSCVVIGGVGFIGSTISRKLAERGARVTAFDDFSNPVGREDVKRLKGVRIVKGDITKGREVAKAVKDADMVFNVAVKCLIESLEDPLAVQQVNDTGALNVVIACREQKKRLVHISSSEVYGSCLQQPIDEHAPLNPTNPYAASKAAAELSVISFVNCYSMDAVVVRPFNAYGPNMREDSYSAVLPRFVGKVLSGEHVSIFGDGLQTRDHTYVDDTVEGILLAAEKLPSGEFVNIARGVEVSVLELARQVVEAIAPDSDYKKFVRFEAARPGDFKRQLASIEKARRLLGFRPKVDIKEGIKRYVEWYKEKHTAG